MLPRKKKPNVPILLISKLFKCIPILIFSLIIGYAGFSQNCQGYFFTAISTNGATYNNVSYTNTASSTRRFQNFTYDLILLIDQSDTYSLNLAWAGGAGYVGAWIDTTGIGDWLPLFTDNTLFDKNASFTNLTIPSTLAIGSYRVRIVLDPEKVATTELPGVNDCKEVSDITMNIQNHFNWSLDTTISCCGADETFVRPLNGVTPQDGSQTGQSDNVVNYGDFTATYVKNGNTGIGIVDSLPITSFGVMSKGTAVVDGSETVEFSEGIKNLNIILRDIDVGKSGYLMFYDDHDRVVSTSRLMDFMSYKGDSVNVSYPQRDVIYFAAINTNSNETDNPGQGMLKFELGGGIMIKKISFVQTALSAANDSGIRMYLSKCAKKVQDKPTTLLDFGAEKSFNEVYLNWNTENEQNSGDFGVEKSTNGNDWFSIGYIASKAPGRYSDISLDYRLVDNAPVIGWNYYRLKIIALDGSYVYSEIRAVKFEDALNITVFPNPTKDIVTIDGITGTEVLNLYDANGQLLIRKRLAAIPTKISLKGISQGIYFGSIISQSGSLIKTFSIFKTY